MEWLIILGLAASSSLDNLGVGVSYGMRRIRIGFSSNMLISLVCFAFSFGGIVFGRWVQLILPGSFPAIVSAALLLAIGMRIIALSAPTGRSKESPDDGKLGVTSILKNPELADMDKSSHISLLEALVLGAALSANALTNGLGAGLIGMSPIAISLASAAGSFATLWIGAKIGEKTAGIRIGKFEIGQFGTVLSGMILVAIAVKSFLLA
ncbi:MAG: sporulation membrane protein YtaF [Clostridiales bacterium]|jgi:putative sporulation protein YtaF|nr:sporulation membrane protein YtaF [Clostridiales bacterium]